MVKSKPRKTRGRSKGKKGRAKPGKKPLSPAEPTERATVNLPASMLKDAIKRAGDKGISAYLRELVKNDLLKAG